MVGRATDRDRTHAPNFRLHIECHIDLFPLLMKCARRCGKHGAQSAFYAPADGLLCDAGDVVRDAYARARTAGGTVATSDTVRAFQLNNAARKNCGV